MPNTVTRIHHLTRPAVHVPLVRRLEPGRSVDAMLDAAIAGVNRQDELMGLIETYGQIATFALKLAGFFTDVFPATSKAHTCAVAEVLDAAVKGYLRHEDDADADVLAAHFLASGLQAATYVYAHYEVSLSGDDAHLRAWSPWEQGPLGKHSDRPVVITFNTAQAPDAATRHVTRQLLQRELLTWADMLSIHRAGIDLMTGELF